MATNVYDKWQRSFIVKATTVYKTEICADVASMSTRTDLAVNNDQNIGWFRFQWFFLNNVSVLVKVRWVQFWYSTFSFRRVAWWALRSPQTENRVSRKMEREALGTIWLDIPRHALRVKNLAYWWECF